MTLIADGFEAVVLKAKFEILCPSCDTTTVTDVMEVLRYAEASGKYTEEAEEDFVRSQLGRVTCVGCEVVLGVHFGHAEVQPARYRFLHYETTIFGMV
jgi:ribosomal protein S27E